MKKAFICYVDMDGILNLFESDKNARINMWNPGYFLNIPVREGISDILVEINKDSYVVILSKVINRVGVTKEKNIWLNNNISQDAYSDIIYVPYDRSKSDYMYSYYPSMLIDDNEKNISECEKKGCQGIFLSDIQVSKRYPNVEKMDDIWTFYKEFLKKL
jgi:5'(3')-deoxyribonucleotidase